MSEFKKPKKCRCCIHQSVCKLIEDYTFVIHKCEGVLSALRAEIPKSIKLSPECRHFDSNGLEFFDREG